MFFFFQIDFALVHLEIRDLLVLLSCPGVKDAIILWILSGSKSSILSAISKFSETILRGK
jgi:hypothetical protein